MHFKCLRNRISVFQFQYKINNIILAWTSIILLFLCKLFTAVMFFILSQDLAIKFKLFLNLGCSCPSLLSPEIAIMCHTTTQLSFTLFERTFSSYKGLLSQHQLLHVGGLQSFNWGPLENTYFISFQKMHERCLLTGNTGAILLETLQQWRGHSRSVKGVIKQMQQDGVQQRRPQWILDNMCAKQNTVYTGQSDHSLVSFYLCICMCEALLFDVLWYC